MRKYRETIDRESAYEILTERVERIRKKAEEEEAQKEWKKENAGRMARARPVPGRTSNRRQPVSPVVKVLTSATFIRGVLGIMKQVIK